MPVTVTAPPKNVMHVICRGCGYTLQYLPSDVQTYHDYDLGIEEGKYVVCPRKGCGKHNTHTEASEESGY